MVQVLKQEGLPQRGNPNHAHRWHEERFANRPDIKFQECDCGAKQYPAGMVRVFEGSHTELLWPT